MFSDCLKLMFVGRVADDEKDFNYIEGSGKGPEDWGDLKEEWATCKTGNMQSPIDLFGRRVEVAPVSEEIHKFYNPGEATLKNRGHDISVNKLNLSSIISFLYMLIKIN